MSVQNDLLPDGPMMQGQSVSGLEYTDEEKHLFSLITGFLKTKVLTAAIDNELFSFLSIRSRTFEEIQNHLKFHPRSTGVFIEALLNMKLIGLDSKNKYRNTGISSKYLVKGKLSYIGGSLDFFESLYEDCIDIKDVLEKGIPTQKKYSYLFCENPRDLAVEEVEGYRREMLNTSGHPVMTLMEFCNFEDSHVVLDIGGGSSKICQNLVSQYKDLQTIFFDLPAVCEKVNEELEDFWLSHRIRVIPGDFFKDRLPGGFDTAIMMRITQDWSRERVKFLLQKVYNSLPRGGKLILYEIFKNDDPGDPGDVAMISLVLLFNTPAGKCRTKKEAKALLEEVGFTSIRFLHTIYIYNAIIATKP
jgi:cyclopropane fatty-acyl-phospholipid synthase-like methyltransferase